MDWIDLELRKLEERFEDLEQRIWVVQKEGYFGVTRAAQFRARAENIFRTEARLTPLRSERSRVYQHIDCLMRLKSEDGMGGKLKVARGARGRV